MKKVILCNVIALVLLTFSGMFVQQVVEMIIGVEATSDGVPAWSNSGWWHVEVHSAQDGVIGSVRNYPVYVLLVATAMNLMFWIRHRAK
ncbi:MAG: hypothetical protein WCC10_04005 [Tumebacillaceae bacterium]